MSDAIHYLGEKKNTREHFGLEQEWGDGNGLVSEC